MVAWVWFYVTFMKGGGRVHETVTGVVIEERQGENIQKFLYIIFEPKKIKDFLA